MIMPTTNSVPINAANSVLLESISLTYCHQGLSRKPDGIYTRNCSMVMHSYFVAPILLLLNEQTSSLYDETHD